MVWAIHLGWPNWAQPDPVGGGTVGDVPVGDGPVGDGPVGNGHVGDGPVGDGPVGAAQYGLCVSETSKYRTMWYTSPLFVFTS